MNKRKTYHQMLRSKKWQSVRKLVLQRDNNTCQNCDSSKNLNVHHLHYIHGVKPINQGIDTMITLCDNCHELEHSKKSISEFFINKSDAIQIYGNIYFSKDIEKTHKCSKTNLNLNSKNQKRLSKLMSKVSKQDKALQQRYDNLKN